MRIGIIGAGGIGQAFASQVAKAGYEVILSNSRGPDSLAAVVRELGPRARAATRYEAAKAGVVFLAVQWPQLRRLSMLRFYPRETRQSSVRYGRRRPIQG